MQKYSVIVLEGDGIGPEVTKQAVRVLEAAAEQSGFELELEHHLIGGAAYHATGKVLPEETRQAVTRSNAVLLGAVGDPSLDSAPRDARPEAALLKQAAYRQQIAQALYDGILKYQASLKKVTTTGQQR